MSKKKILGFDVSSSMIGWCLLEIDEGFHSKEMEQQIKYIDSGLFKPKKEGNILERLENTRNEISKIINKCSPDYIGIEDIINFIRNKSSANTIITLAVFNRMIGLLAFDFLKKSPELFGVLSIRHGLKFNKIFPKKEDMPEIVAKHLNIKFPYKLMTMGKNKGKPHITNYDRADAMSVALYYAFVLTGKLANKSQNKPKISKKK